MSEKETTHEDVHYVDLPQDGAEAKILKWNERIAQGMTMLPRSTVYYLGKPKGNEPNHVGVYIRRSTV